MTFTQFDHLYEDEEVEKILIWLHLYKNYRLGKNTKEIQKKFIDVQQKTPNHLLLDRQGAPQFKICILAAPLGSGMTSLSKFLAKNYNKNPLIIEAMDLNGKDQLQQQIQQYLQRSRLFKTSQDDLLIIENADRLQQYQINFLNKCINNSTFFNVNKKATKNQIIINKPIFLTTTNLYSQSLRLIRNLCLSFNINPVFNKIHKLLNNQITHQEFYFHNQNYSFIKNNISTFNQISQPSIVNLAAGILIRVPEVSLNIYDMQRFQAQQFLNKLNFHQQYGSPGQYLQILNQLSFDYNQLNNKLLQNIFFISAMKQRASISYQNINNDYILDEILNCGSQNSRIYTNYINSLSEQYQYNYQPVLPVYMLLNQLNQSVYMSAQNQQQTIQKVQYSPNQNYQYEISSAIQLQQQVQQQTQYIDSDFFTTILPLCQSIIYSGANKVISIDTLTTQEIQCFSDSVIIATDLKADLTTFFNILKPLNKQNDEIRQVENQQLNGQFQHYQNFYQYMEEGLTENVRRIIKTCEQKIKVENSVEKQLEILSNLFVQNQEVLKDEIEYIYNEGVTLAVRTTVKLKDLLL